MKKDRQNINEIDALKGFLFRGYNARRCINVGQALPDDKIDCHAETSLLSISTALTSQGRDPEQKRLRMTTPFKEKALNRNPFRAPLRSGFTLIELLVVVLIIGILAAIAVPQYQQAVEKSKTMQLLVSLKALAEAEEVYYLEKGRYATSFSNLNVTYPTKADSLTLKNGTTLYVSQAHTMRVYGLTKHVEISVFTKHGQGQASTRHKPGMMICATNVNDKIGTHICKSLSRGIVVQDRFGCTFGLCTSYLLHS